MHIIYLSIIALLLLKIFKQGIRINGYEDAENSREIEEACCYHVSKEDCNEHPWKDGDCCRCEECTERFHKELAETLVPDKLKNK